MNIAEAPPPLVDAAEIAERVERVAEALVPRLENDAIAVCLLTGGLWFAADLTRALARKGRLLRFDALWLSSYGDGRRSEGRVEVRSPLQRPVAGAQVLVIDDVLDSGLSLGEAVRILREAGARAVLTTVFARKPWPRPRVVEPDAVGWEAPSRYLVGYGLDSGGAFRGLPYVAALD